jgi:uncharacterized membrane protein
MQFVVCFSGYGSNSGLKERKNLMSNISIFALGAVQVALVSLNTYQIANRHWVSAFIVGFLISFVWTFNVRSIVFGGLSGQLIYALGASFGTIVGLGIGVLLHRKKQK